MMSQQAQIQSQMTAPRDKVKNLAELLVKKKAYLQQILPGGMRPERLIKVALMCASQTPALLQCTPESFVLAVIKAAELGLEPGSALGEAYLVPYKGKVQMITGYRGMITLARRSGQVASLSARAVHARDVFRPTYGTEEKIEHIPYMPVPPSGKDGKRPTEAEVNKWIEDSDPGELIAVYAVARLQGGMLQTATMTRAEVEKIRARSMARDNGPWVTDYEQMALKTVIRRISKYLPMSVELLERAANEEHEENPAMDISDILEGIERNAMEAPASRTQEIKDTVAKATSGRKAQPVESGERLVDDQPSATGQAQNQ